jgi:hypothetical protein
MTDSLGASRAVGSGAAELRLQLKSHAPASAYLDGAWWPRSVELAAEQPTLVEALSDRLGELAVVGYHRNAWTQAPPQMQIERGTAQLPAFTSDEPATVVLIGHDRRRVTLRVVSPQATETVARQELDAASKDLGDTPPADNRAEQVVARSVTEVAAQLARHEGRADPERTAAIARWCQEAAQQFVNAPVQTFVPILVHHLVRNRMGVSQTAI